MMNVPDLPFIVSYPRSGSHLLSCSLELYTGKPRLFRPGRGPVVVEALSLVDQEDLGEFGWIQAHDPDCPPTPKRYIVLTRNPVDTLYSYAAARGILHKEGQIREWLSQYGAEWTWHHHRWFPKAKAIIQYEKHNEADWLRPAVEFLGFQWDPDKASECKARASREQLSEAAPPHLNAYFNRRLSSEDYADDRQMFSDRYGFWIWATINRVREIIKEYGDDNEET